MTAPLTDRQIEILVFMWDFLQENQYLPTTKCIAQKFGFKSENAVVDHREAMARRGYLKRCPALPCRYMLTDAALQLMRQSA